MEIECKDCGIVFDPWGYPHHKYGYFNQCFQCGAKTDVKNRRNGNSRHVGIQGGEGLNKSGNISIIRNPTIDQVRMVRNQNNGRFAPNLPLSSAVNETIRKGKEEEKEINGAL